MAKKIRRFYWHMRDRGKGRQVIAAALIFLLAFALLIGLTGRGITYRYHRQVQNNIQKSGTNAGTATGTAIEAESEDISETEEDKEVQTDVPAQTPAAWDVDTSGLDTFLGFMSEDCFAQMEEEVEQICSDCQCKSAEKLDYQQTEDGSFDVRSFILLSDGSIYQCDYNLKSTQYELSSTDYTEADIEAMREQELQQEQEELLKQQKKAKKKQQKKSSAKKSSQKKSSAKKNKK